MQLYVIIFQCTVCDDEVYKIIIIFDWDKILVDLLAINMLLKT